jgi:hypothetical protein
MPYLLAKGKATGAAVFVAPGGDVGLIKAWLEAKAPVELHYYERGGHGLGMRHQSTTSDLWAEQFYAWMKARGGV